MKEQLDIIFTKLTSIEGKLDRMIKAMQEHDGVDEDYNGPEEDEYSWGSINSAAVERVSRFLDEEKVEEKPKSKRKYYKSKKKK